MKISILAPNSTGEGTRRRGKGQTCSTVSSNTKFINWSKPRSTPVTVLFPFSLTAQRAGSGEREGAVSISTAEIWHVERTARSVQNRVCCTHLTASCPCICSTKGASRTQQNSVVGTRLGHDDWGSILERLTHFLRSGPVAGMVAAGAGGPSSTRGDDAHAHENALAECASRNSTVTY